MIGDRDQIAILVHNRDAGRRALAFRIDGGDLVSHRHRIPEEDGPNVPYPIVAERRESAVIALVAIEDAADM